MQFFVLIWSSDVTLITIKFSHYRKIVPLYGMIMFKRMISYAAGGKPIQYAISSNRTNVKFRYSRYLGFYLYM